MSFPNVLYGPEGEQFSRYTTQRWPLGTQLVMQDGRKYRFTLAGGTTLVIGDLLTSKANVANDVDRTGIAAAVGSKAPTLTLGGATTANLYAEGFWNISVTPGGGESYLINNHLAGTTAVVFNLESGHTLRTAITITSRVDLIANPYKSVIQTPVTTTTAAPVGVAVSAGTNAEYGWVQTAGMDCVLTSGTVVLGAPVANIQVAGAVGPLSTTIATTVVQQVVGTCQRVAAGAAWSAVKLLLDG